MINGKKTTNVAVALALALLAASATSCGGQKISPAEIDYSAKATEMTANMAELASDSSFVSVYTASTEITDIISDFAMGDYEKPDKIYRLEFDAEKFITAMMYDGTVSTDVLAHAAKRASASLVATQINAAYMGANYLAAASLLTDTESFVMPADFETDFALFLEYDDGFDSLVGFKKAGENVITASLSVVFDAEFPERLADLFGEDGYTFEEIE